MRSASTTNSTNHMCVSREQQQPNQTLISEGNLLEQQVTQSLYLSLGQFFMQLGRSEPSSPPVQDGDEHRLSHSATQTWKIAASVGQVLMQFARDPPGQSSGKGLGAGVGAGLGNGVGGLGAGVGAGAEYVPLVTQPPQSSSRGEPTELFNQHS